MQTCRTCSVEKALSEFYMRSEGKPHTQCKSCYVARVVEWQRTLPPAQKKLRSARRAQARRTKETGWSDEDYKAALEAQGGLCAICGDPAEPLCADHDHASGAKRELLCHACNRGLGDFRDDPERLRAAAAYVERHAESIVYFPEVVY